MGKWDSIVLRDGKSRFLDKTVLNDGESVLEYCSAYDSLRDLFRWGIGYPDSIDESEIPAFCDFLDELEEYGWNYILLNLEIVVFCEGDEVVSVGSVDSAMREAVERWEESKNDKA